MPEEERRARRSKWHLFAATWFSMLALTSLFIGNYWIALAQAGFAAAISLVYVGAEERRDIFIVLLWAFLGITVLASIISLATWEPSCSNCC
jgi:hypothetical protein